MKVTGMQSYQLRGTFLVPPLCLALSHILHFKYCKKLPFHLLLHRGLWGMIFKATVYLYMGGTTMGPNSLGLIKAGYRTIITPTNKQSNKM